MNERSARIALVGHCGPDSFALRSAAGRAVPGAGIVFANDARAAEVEFEKADLLLVNRVLDGEFESVEGVGLIRALVSRPVRAGARRAAVMLVSNFAEAQKDAVAAGAGPGFGKKEMNSERVRGLIRAAVGREAVG